MRPLLTLITNWLEGYPRGASKDRLITDRQIWLDQTLESEEGNSFLTEKGLRLTEVDFQDISQILALESAGYEGYLAWRRPDFQKDIRSNPLALYLLLWSGDQLVAMVSGRILAKRTHISHLIVHPEWQSQGLGSYLLSLWQEATLSLGLFQISLEMQADNERLYDFYRGHGFALETVVEAYYSQAKDAYVLVWRARGGDENGIIASPWG